ELERRLELGSSDVGVVEGHGGPAHTPNRIDLCATLALDGVEHIPRRARYVKHGARRDNASGRGGPARTADVNVLLATGRNGDPEMRPVVAGGVKGNGRRVDRELGGGDGHQSPPEAGDDPPEVAKFKRTTPGALLGLSALGRRRGLLLATFDY